MTSIRITNKQEKKLIEMCEALFPEYTKIQYFNYKKRHPIDFLYTQFKVIHK